MKRELLKKSIVSNTDIEADRKYLLSIVDSINQLNQALDGLSDEAYSALFNRRYDGLVRGLNDIKARASFLRNNSKYLR